MEYTADRGNHSVGWFRRRVSDVKARAVAARIGPRFIDALASAQGEEFRKIGERAMRLL